MIDYNITGSSYFGITQTSNNNIIYTLNNNSSAVSQYVRLGECTNSNTIWQICYVSDTSDSPTTITTTDAIWNISYGAGTAILYGVQPRKPDIKHIMRREIKNRLYPYIVTRNPHNARDEKEKRALETLKTVIGESGYRRYIKHGFVSIRAKSGLVYQIFPGYRMTKVYDNGKLLYELCVILKGEFPPTDQLLTRLLILKHDEKKFRQLAIKHRATKDTIRRSNRQQLQLQQIWNNIKCA